jgi:hypothetical protein
MFATEVVALAFDKHGWNNSATVAMKLFELSLIIGVLGPICFFVNLLVIGNWRCPRCHDKPTGWVEKEAKSLDCGLEVRCAHPEGAARNGGTRCPSVTAPAS